MPLEEKCTWQMIKISNTRESRLHPVAAVWLLSLPHQCDFGGCRESKAGSEQQKPSSSQNSYVRSWLCVCVGSSCLTFSSLRIRITPLSQINLTDRLLYEAAQPIISMLGLFGLFISCSWNSEKHTATFLPNLQTHSSWAILLLSPFYCD